MTSIEKILQVFEIDKYFCDRSGNIYSRSDRHGGLVSKNEARKLRPSKSKSGYLIYTFSDVNGKSFYMTGHKAIFLFFNKEVPDGLQINHKDLDKENNSLSNLEAITPEQNRLHAKKHGRYLLGGYANNPIRGEDNHKSKLTEKDVLTIRATNNMLYKDMAKKWGVSLGTIKSIRRGSAWKHLL